MTKDEALDLAMESLEHMLEDAKQERLTVEYWNECVDAIAAIKQALAAPYVATPLVQEPVRGWWAHTSPITGITDVQDWQLTKDDKARGWIEREIYTTPPTAPVQPSIKQGWDVDTLLDKPAAQRQSVRSTWVGLTDEQINLFINGRGDEDDDDYVEPTGDGFGITDADLVKLVRRAEAKLKEKNSD